MQLVIVLDMGFISGTIVTDGLFEKICWLVENKAGINPIEL